VRGSGAGPAAATLLAALAGGAFAGPAAGPPPALPFTDVTAEAGISFVHTNGARGEKLLPETMGGGVAFFDYDGDGDQDLLLVDSAPWPGRRDGALPPPVVLYANDGRGRFRDVTRETGIAEALPPGFYGMGVAVADVDGDGWRDVFLTAVGTDRLLANRGGRFVDVTAAAGVGGTADGWSTGTAFFDADGDGDLDLVVVDYLGWSREVDARVERRADSVATTYGRPQAYAGTRPRLYLNLGDGRFEDHTAASGLAARPGGAPLLAKGLAVLPLDADGDGRLDLFVANDTEANHLFRNLGGARFEEVGESWGVAWDAHGRATGAMGVDAGHPAPGDPLTLVVGNFAGEASSAYRAAEEGGFFTDESQRLGLAAPTRGELTFGVLLVDTDLDGRLDVVQANGHVEPDIARLDPGQSYRQPGQLLWHDGERWVALAPEAVGDLGRPAAGRGLAAADVDGDGDPDLVMTQVGGPARLLRNDQSTGHHWLRVAVRGRGANADALGAVVELTAGGVTLRRVVEPTRSYLSQCELPVTFGLGARVRVDSLTVTWPDGTRRTLDGEAVEIDRLLVVAPEEESGPAPQGGAVPAVDRPSRGD
jgi:hypothetical protein